MSVLNTILNTFEVKCSKNIPYTVFVELPKSADWWAFRVDAHARTAYFRGGPPMRGKKNTNKRLILI